MAFDRTKFERIGGGLRQLFMYSSADAIATIIAADYFNTATDDIRQNDVIIAVGSTGGARTVDMLVVTSATGAASVTTTNGT